MLVSKNRFKIASQYKLVNTPVAQETMQAVEEVFFGLKTLQCLQDDALLLPYTSPSNSLPTHQSCNFYKYQVLSSLCHQNSLSLNFVILPFVWQLLPQVHVSLKKFFYWLQYLLQVAYRIFQGLQ